MILPSSRLLEHLGLLGELLLRADLPKVPANCRRGPGDEAKEAARS